MKLISNAAFRVSACDSHKYELRQKKLTCQHIQTLKQQKLVEPLHWFPTFEIDIKTHTLQPASFFMYMPIQRRT